jgi:hypothetical protein
MLVLRHTEPVADHFLNITPSMHWASNPMAMNTIAAAVRATGIEPAKCDVQPAQAYLRGALQPHGRMRGGMLCRWGAH